MGSDHFNAAFSEKPLVMPIAVINFIADKTLRRVFGKATVDSGFDQVTSWGDALAT